jgi:hypothetical protein
MAQNKYRASTARAAHRATSQWSNWLQKTRCLAGRTLIRITPSWKSRTKPRIVWWLVAWRSPDCPARQRDALCLWQKWQPSLGAPLGKLKQLPSPCLILLHLSRGAFVQLMSALSEALAVSSTSIFPLIIRISSLYSILQSSLPLSRSFEFRGLGKNSQSLS